MASKNDPAKCQNVVNASGIGWPCKLTVGLNHFKKNWRKKPILWCNVTWIFLHSAWPHLIRHPIFKAVAGETVRAVFWYFYINCILNFDTLTFVYLILCCIQIAYFAVRPYLRSYSSNFLYFIWSAYFLFLFSFVYLVHSIFWYFVFCIARQQELKLVKIHTGQLGVILPSAGFVLASPFSVRVQMLSIICSVSWSLLHPTQLPSHPIQLIHLHILLLQKKLCQ